MGEGTMTKIDTTAAGPCPAAREFYGLTVLVCEKGTWSSARGRKPSPGVPDCSTQEAGQPGIFPSQALPRDSTVLSAGAPVECECVYE